MTTRINLEEIERLAKVVGDAAISERSFEVFLDDGPNTELQKAVTDFAQTLRYRHDDGDDCTQP